jgi:broad specificity phosphatase PhoE
MSGSTNPTASNYDSLTDLGRQQVMATARRLQQSAGLRSVIAAPEQRTRDTALAITLYSLLPFATVDNDLTSKAFEGETAAQRADRLQRAVERELDRLSSQSGNLAVVTHGHVIQYLTLKLAGQPLTGTVASRQEMGNAGVQPFYVRKGADGKYVWSKAGEGDKLVLDEP